MAGNKKTKKKYTPRTVYIPKLIISTTKANRKLVALTKLREEMIANDGFDEETIEEAIKELRICKKILNIVPPSQVRFLAQTVGKERLAEKESA